MRRYRLTLLALCLGLSVPATAGTLKGTATNSTTGKPAAGDEVVLLSMPGGTAEIGRGRTDAGGHFNIAVDDKPVPRLVRVIHQRVAYHRVALAGARSVEVQVCDAAETLEDVTATSDMRLQSDDGALEVIDEIVVSNASHPPRTLVNARPLEIHLPPGAQVVGGAVQAGDGNRVRQMPVPGGEKGRYYFPYPLPPGKTRFAVAYRLPFQGETEVQSRITYPLTRLVVVLPKSMKFEGKTPGMFKAIPGEEVNVQFAGTVKPGQSPAFRVSGTGTLLPAKRGQQQARDGQTARAGGSRGAPAEARDTPASLRWLFLSGLALILAAAVAGVVAHKRKQPRRPSARVGLATSVPLAPGRLQH